ncbi:MAG: 2-C-methyl-D-erythritol 4-phosphate cytidylyltransferase [Deltaproteobacteria bacterium]|nr:2-C-methyl-D-erythritol 4-phosphate cytidylyltransferase [Deltaproteobacteria bacterium]MBW2362689.1 2-C-methyl-D-erythritol 4-phosphate cytidylyltransferase [Deltaproteobacteria bacterium]
MLGGVRVAAVVVAAGRGERFRQRLPKAFVSLAGRPLVLHAVEALSAVAAVSCVQPVVAREELSRFEALLAGAGELPKLAPAVAGGAERQDSVRAGLAVLPADCELVAVHDAARALVRPAAVARVIEVAKREGAAILAAPVQDTLKRVEKGRILETPDRASFWAAQTPQVFRVDCLREAHAKAVADGVRGTDDAALVERLGVEVHVVAGDADNFKLTHPQDLVLAEQILAQRSDRA